MKKKSLIVVLCFVCAMSFGQWTRSGSKVYLTNSSDKVGLGTSNPSEKLHINGAIRGNEDGGALRIQTSNGYLTLGPKNGSWCHFYTDMSKFFFDKSIFVRDGKIASYNTSDLKLCTNNDVRIFVENSNGNVGIGTTSPASKLSVNGKIRAKEVEITLSGWSDYVFEENYSLMSIKTLEQHIKENKHLPGIPSEQEVLEKGIALGEISSSLLGKIEELTLYIIEQNHRIESLEKEIQALKMPVNKE